jgi:hypothetical protein
MSRRYFTKSSIASACVSAAFATMDDIALAAIMAAPGAAGAIPLGIGAAALFWAGRPEKLSAPEEPIHEAPIFRQQLKA